MPRKDKLPPSKELVDCISNYKTAVNYIYLVIYIIPNLDHFLKFPPLNLKQSKTFEFSKEAWDYFKKKVPTSKFENMVLRDYVKNDVEIFEYYLTSMLFKVFSQRPETLKRSDPVALSEVLDCENLEEFVLKTAEKKVADLGYMGLEGIIDYLSKLGIKLDKRINDFEKAKEFLEVRNIIVHNQGRVNSIFKKKTGRKDLEIGDVYPLSTKYCLDSAKILEKLARELDRLFLTKFKLSP